MCGAVKAAAAIGCRWVGDCYEFNLKRYWSCERARSGSFWRRMCGGGRRVRQGRNIHTQDAVGEERKKVSKETLT